MFLLIGGGLVICLYSIGLLSLLGISIMKIPATKEADNKEPKSRFNLLTFVKGLNLNRKLFSLIYFCHFIGIRLLVAVFVLLSP